MNRTHSWSFSILWWIDANMILLLMQNGLINFGCIPINLNIL